MPDTLARPGKAARGPQSRLAQAARKAGLSPEELRRWLADVVREALSVPRVRAS